MKRLILIGIFYSCGLGTSMGKSLNFSPVDTLITINKVIPLRSESAKLISTAGIFEKETLPAGVAPDRKQGSFITRNLNTDAIDFITTFYRMNTQGLEIIRAHGEPYLKIISRVFRQYGIPNQLKYLAVIESGLNTNAVSPVGAVGAWQFMAGTARFLGLDVSRNRDDRRNFYKSTTAAARYLCQMHGLLQNWLLVVAAYNCGTGGVLKAITASGSNNFWDLKDYLPEESRKHVMKFIATAYIMDRYKSFFGLGVPKSVSRLEIPIPAAPDTTNGKVGALDISGHFCLSVIARHLNLDSAGLAVLNPDFESLSATGNNFILKLPVSKLDEFIEDENAILNESVIYLIKHNIPPVKLKGNLRAERFHPHHKSIRRQMKKTKMPPL